MNYRNKKLLYLARGQSCQSCGAQDDTVVSAHSNSWIHGKGTGIKAHDCFVAWLCCECHASLDSEKGMTRDERRDIWRAAHDKTILEMFRQNLLTVA